jgi:tetratricopeptide (TPR) repeat protein
MLERAGRFDEAIEEWTVVARLRPDLIEPFSRAAVLAVEMPILRKQQLDPHSKTADLAQRLIQSGVARGGQGDPGLAYAAGRLQLAAGKWSSAWQLLSDAKQWGFDPVRVRFWYYRAAVNRGAMLAEAGRAQDALDDLEFLRATQPDHPDERFLLVDLAVVRSALDEPEDAKKILEEVLAKTPGAADAHYLYALILIRQGRLEEAEKKLEETMRYATGSFSDKEYRNALLKLCDVQLKLDRLDDAEKSVNRFMELAKDDPDGLFVLGRVKQGRGQFEEAAKLFRRVARMAPQWLETLINLKKVLHEMGEEAEAEEIGRRIIEIEKKRSAEVEGRAPTMGAPPPKR